MTRREGRISTKYLNYYPFLPPSPPSERNRPPRSFCKNSRENSAESRRRAVVVAAAAVAAVARVS